MTALRDALADMARHPFRTAGDALGLLSAIGIALLVVLAGVALGY